MSDCLFCKLVAGQIPAQVVYETDAVLAFRDIHPQAPSHVLIIPKVHLSTLNDLDDPQLAGQLLLAAKTVAEQEGLAEDGYRTVINCRENGGQVVFHLHLHVMGGRAMRVPMG